MRKWAFQISRFSIIGEMIGCVLLIVAIIKFHVTT